MVTIGCSNDGDGSVKVEWAFLWCVRETSYMRAGRVCSEGIISRLDKDGTITIAAVTSSRGLGRAPWLLAKVVSFTMMCRTGSR